MAEIPGWLLPHTISRVDTYAGTSGTGDTYVTTVGVDQVKIDHDRRMVRNDDGDEVVSEATIFARTHRAPLFPAGSRVYLDDRVATVIGCKLLTDGGAGAWEHVEVTLT